jgi:predicted RNase H-like HicB family nuclease
LISFINAAAAKELLANNSGVRVSQPMNIKVIVEPSEDGYFVAHVPSLKSCWSQGKTKEEALQNIREAIDLYLEPEPNDASSS